MWYLFSCDRLVSLGVMSSGFIRVAAGVRIPFLSDTEGYPTVWMDPTLFFCPSIEGHSGDFCLLAVVNDTAMNLGVQVSLQDPALHSLG